MNLVCVLRTTFPSTVTALALLAWSTCSVGETAGSATTLSPYCENQLKQFPGKINADFLKLACTKVQVLPACESEKGKKIFHFDKDAKADSLKPQKILVFSLVHGDETPSGSVARAWVERLASLETRNHWRIIPILNPDGTEAKTRTNANGIDINRNFPTKDWDLSALDYWSKKTKKDSRRYPGPAGGSAKETICAIRHIDDFKPDLVLSIHTPFGVLDFDGPKIQPPNFKGIPWKSLGNYPGSLGRYLWVDRNLPTLTIELKGNHLDEKFDQFDRLQDITGDIAIAAGKALENESGKK